MSIFPVSSTQISAMLDWAKRRMLTGADRTDGAQRFARLERNIGGSITNAGLGATAKEIANFINAGLSATAAFGLTLGPQLSVVLSRPKTMCGTPMDISAEGHRRSGAIFCLPTIWQQQKLFRLCVGNPETRADDVLAALQTLNEGGAQ